jgi:hypothetical protein
METHGQDDGDDSRHEPRQRVFKGGRIIFNRGYSVFDCRVRNLSAGGAMLEMPSLLGIPSHFDIALDASNKHRPCTVMWRTEKLMGVAFDEVGSQAA